MRAFDVLSCQKALIFGFLHAVDESPSFSFFNVFHSLEWSHGALHTSFRYIKSFNRLWRDAVTRSSIPHHFAFIRHLSHLEGFFSLLPVLLIYKCYAYISRFGPFCVFSSVSLSQFSGALHAAMFLFRHRVYSFFFFFVRSFWCLRAALLRFARVLSFSGSIQLRSSLFCFGVL